MRKALNQFKQFFRIPTVSGAYAAGDGFAETCVVDLNAQEKDFVNLQTNRLLLRKRARQMYRNPGSHWTAALPPMPHHGSAYARCTVR